MALISKDDYVSNITRLLTKLKAEFDAEQEQIDALSTTLSALNTQVSSIQTTLNALNDRALLMMNGDDAT